MVPLLLLLLLLLLLFHPGVLRVQGWDVVDEQWEIAQHGALGYVPQEGGLFDFLTVQVGRDGYLLGHG